MKDGAEPSLVVDNSVAMVWAFEDETDFYAMSVLDAMTRHTAAVPALFLSEVTNSLIVATRKGRITSRESLVFIGRLEGLPIQIVPTSTFQQARELYDFARTTGLTAYDAQYLQLAQSFNLPLATLDKEILAAMTSLGVPRFQP